MGVPAKDSGTVLAGAPDYENMERIMRNNGAVQYQGGPVPDGMAFARPFGSSGNNPIANNLMFGGRAAPNAGEWMISADKYNELFPVTKTPGIVGGAVEAVNEMKGGLAVGAAPFAVGAAAGAPIGAEFGIGDAVGGMAAPEAVAAGAPVASAAEGAATAGGAVQTVLPATQAAGTAGTLKTIKDVATVAGPIASLAGAAAGIDASKKLGASVNAMRSGGTVLGTPAPVVFPPATMPVFGSEKTMAIQRKTQAEQLQRRGRASTVLTSDAASSDRLGA